MELLNIRPSCEDSASGLERDPVLRTIGPAFLALLDRVCGIFAYDPQQLEDIHLQVPRSP